MLTSSLQRHPWNLGVADADHRSPRHSGDGRTVEPTLFIYQIPKQEYQSVVYNYTLALLQTTQEQLRLRGIIQTR